MTMNKTLSLAALAAFFCVACSPGDKDQAQKSVEQIKDKTKEVVSDAADKGKQALSKTGEVITDGWVTTKVKAKFADDKLLKDSDINVDTKEGVVTLKGTVVSDAARKQAVAIANGTEGVMRVVNELTLKSK